MLFYNNTIHDFDLARWLSRDEVAEVHAFATVTIRPEVAEYGDIVAGTVNLRFQGGAIGNVESYVQCQYGYDVRTEIVGSKGTIITGYLQQTAEVVLTSAGSRTDIVDHFLVRFADGYLHQMRDFVQTILADRAPKVDALDGRQAVAVAAAAERSYRENRVVAVQNRLRTQ